MKEFLDKILLVSFCFVLLLFGVTNSWAAMPKDIGGLYQSTEHELFWSGTRQVKKNRDKIKKIIDNAPSHGLSLTAFDIERLTVLDEIKNHSAESLMKIDQAYTYALWRYASKLNGGDLSQAEFIEIVLSNAIEQNIEGLAPQTNLYLKLKQRLIEIDKAIRDRDLSDVTPNLTFGHQIFRAGQSHSDVPLLRARMIEYGTDGSFGDDPYAYDSILVDAVKSYQSQHGLKSDGIIGPSTLNYLNRTLESEREQIIVNMDRLRNPIWRNRPDLRIDVDIARYWLTAYENGTTQFEMPVVVGSKKRKTVRFSTVMTGVRLNPGWTLPPTIKTEDYIPKLRTNPEWVTNRGVKIYADWSHQSEPIDPTTVDWTLLSDGEIKAMRMYKSAGASNPLGLYRFLMNNKYDIYLHDTNAKRLFQRTMRAKSSGCVRVHNPRLITEFLLKDDPSWTSERIDEVLASGKTYDVGAKRKIPVYFDYKTVWLDEQGLLTSGIDIYGFDNDVIRDIFKFEKQTKQTISTLIKSIPVPELSQNESNDTQDIFPISLF